VSGDSKKPRLPHFRRRLRAALSDELQGSSRIIATARAFLATSALVAIYVDPTEPTKFAPLAYSMLAGYVVYSLVVLALLRIHGSFHPRAFLLLHAIDVVWATSITFFTEGPNSPFYLFFLFVLLAAAYRWGFRETMLTAATAAAILIVQALVPVLLPRYSELGEGSVEINRFIMRSTYLLLMGLLLGYLAEEEKTVRAEGTFISRLAAKAQTERGLRGSLHLVLGDILQLFDAPQALLFLEENESGRLFLWEARATEGSGPVLQWFEMDASQREAFLFPAPARSWFAERSRPGSEFETRVAFDELGTNLPKARVKLPESFLAAYSCRSMVGVSLTFGPDWSGRLYLIDPSIGGDHEKAVQFLDALLRETGPALYNVYLLRRLRSRIGAVERARAARELHDGAIQSLLAVEMKVDVLRRQAAGESESLRTELERVQQLLHNEVLNLRDLTDQMRPVDLAPRHLLPFLADAAEKFQRETGITTRFTSDVEQVTLAPRVARELARVVQEALVNVRKHSGARNVAVRLASTNGHWLLVVDDDGRGFDFSGRRSLAELDEMRKGPAVIKERIRSIGGELTIESTPGTGSRLEISLQQRMQG
jgi:signal transduction histidine kinase